MITQPRRDGHVNDERPTRAVAREACPTVRAVQEWYRTPDWDAAAQADFEVRLGRARGSRPEYLRVKAHTLHRAGRLDDAAQLYDRYLREHPDELPASLVHEYMGDLARDRGRLDEAERRYRFVLTLQPLLMSSGMTAVSLAEVLLDQGRAEDAADALARADEDSVTAFHANLFRVLTASARIAHTRGDVDAAAADADRALGLIGAPNQYSRHPGVGAVDPDDPAVALLRSMLPQGGGRSPGS